MPTMTSNHAKNVLLLFGWLDMECLAGAAEYALEAGWHLTTDMVRHGRIVGPWQGDGILSLLGGNDEMCEFIERYPDLPKVDMGSTFPNLDLPRVKVDNTKNGEIAAEFFLSKGFRNFAIARMYDSNTERARLDAFAAALKSEGYDTTDLTPPPEKSATAGHWEETREWFADKLRTLDKPTAVFVNYPSLGRELVEAALEAGLTVPDEVSVLCGEDDPLMCPRTTVPLSAIDIQMREVGYRAAQRLDELMHGNTSTESLLLPPGAVVERRSTDTFSIRHPMVRRAMDYIADNFHRPISVKDILSVVPLSRMGLYKIFQNELRRTPSEEIRNRRLALAAKLLRDTDDSLTDIAHQVGYSNGIALTAPFRKRFGLPPHRWRMEQAKQRPAGLL